MKCRINLDSDPISLIILSADGYEHAKLDGGGHDGIIDVDIAGTEMPCPSCKQQMTCAGFKCFRCPPSQLPS